MQDKTCAYCGKNGVMTREHVFPKWMYEDTPQHDTQFLRRSRKFTTGEITIRDVCEHCNNGPLSLLDSYSKGMYERYWSTIVHPGDAVNFEYDFDLLARWLLKVSFNSARMYQHETDHAARLADYAPYILGNAPRPTGLRLLVQLILPYRVQPHEAHLVRSGVSQILPVDIRMGRPPQQLTDLTGAVCRLIGLNSYYFYVLMPMRRDRAIGHAVRTFQRKWDNVACLKPEQNVLTLRPSNLDLLEAKYHNIQEYRTELMDHFGK